MTSIYSAAKARRESQPKQEHQQQRRRRTGKRNFVVGSIAILLGLCFTVENIGWSKSIANELTSRHFQEDGNGFGYNSRSARGGGSGSASAFCLLIKDDNDILREWIAYHYHVFRMRRLIVAIDPDSRTSPLEILRSWTSENSHEGRFHLDFTLWKDEDYTPEFFHGEEKDYSKIPISVGQEVTFEENEGVGSNSAKTAADIQNRPILKTYWHRNETYAKENQDEVLRSTLLVNNHRFRQKNFVSECFRKIKEEQIVQQHQNQKQQDVVSWTVHIDTDEFLVPNPWITSYVASNASRSENNSSTHGHKQENPAFRKSTGFRMRELESFYPRLPLDGSLWTFFNNYLGTAAKRYGACVMMPRILFGSREEGDGASTTATETLSARSTSNTTDTIIASWNHTKFESLRWKYHTDFESSNERPKSMVNAGLLTLPQPRAFLEKNRGESIFRGNKLVRSIHRPLKNCPGEPKIIYNTRHYNQPLAVFHYLGSLERYMKRPDVRRDPVVYHRYNSRANSAIGDLNHNASEPKNDTDNDIHRPPRWMAGWLDEFVKTHGAEASFSVLGETYGSLRRTTPTSLEAQKSAKQLALFDA